MTWPQGVCSTSVIERKQLGGMQLELQRGLAYSTRVQLEVNASGLCAHHLAANLIASLASDRASIEANWLIGYCHR